MKKNKTKRGGKRPGAGRPKSDNPASERVAFRVTPDLLERLINAARRNETTTSALARLYVERALDGA
jgi:hypothetical protein